MNEQIKTRIVTSLTDVITEWAEKERESGNLLDGDFYLGEETEYYMTQAALNVLWSTIEIQKFINQNT